MPVPVALREKIWQCPGVRMGDYLAAVSLVDCTTIEPVIVNQRPLFLGITRAADLDGWDPPPFTSDDGVDVADAPRFFD